MPTVTSTSPFGQRARRVAFRGKTRVLAGSTHRVLQDLMAAQHRPVDLLLSDQRRQAADLVAFAAEASPFYRDLYADAGLSRRDLLDPESFAALPTVDRTLAHDHAAQMRTSEYDASVVEVRTTSGSTGVPLKTAIDRRFPYQALAWRSYTWWGVQPWDDVVHVGRWEPANRKAQLAYLARWWPTRQRWFQAGDLNPEVMQGFVDSLRQAGAPLVEGYLGPMVELATYLRSTGQTVPAPLAVGVTATPLTPALRQHVQRALGAPVYDQYRCSEVPFIAAECREQSGLHVFADRRVLEVVDDAGAPVPAGVEGSIVVTDLTNRVHPILRYRLGDRGVLLDQPCGCGITLPLMASPKGRANTLLRMPDGSVLAAGVVTIFAGIPDAVRQFQIHQRADYSVLIRVIAEEGDAARRDIDAAIALLRERMKNQVPVTVEFVDRIEPVRGKINYVMCDVPAPHDV